MNPYPYTITRLAKLTGYSTQRIQELRAEGFLIEGVDYRKIGRRLYWSDAAKEKIGTKTIDSLVSPKYPQLMNYIGYLVRPSEHRPGQYDLIGLTKTGYRYLVAGGFATKTDAFERLS